MRALPQKILQLQSADSCGAGESFCSGFSGELLDGVLSQKRPHYLGAGRSGALGFRVPGGSVHPFQLFQPFVDALSHAATVGGSRAISLKFRLSPWRTA